MRDLTIKHASVRSSSSEQQNLEDGAKRDEATHHGILKSGQQQQQQITNSLIERNAPPFDSTPSTATLTTSGTEEADAETRRYIQLAQNVHQIATTLSMDPRRLPPGWVVNIMDPDRSSQRDADQILQTSYQLIQMANNRPPVTVDAPLLPLPRQNIQPPLNHHHHHHHLNLAYNPTAETANPPTYQNNNDNPTANSFPFNFNLQQRFSPQSSIPMQPSNNTNNTHITSQQQISQETLLLDQAVRSLSTPRSPSTETTALSRNNQSAAAIAPPQRQRRTRNRRQPITPLKCQSCGAVETPEWRRGPLGPRTLCNACGLIYAKLKPSTNTGSSSTTASSSVQSPSSAVLQKQQFNYPPVANTCGDNVNNLQSQQLVNNPTENDDPMPTSSARVTPPDNNNNNNNNNGSSSGSSQTSSEGSGRKKLRLSNLLH